MGTKSDFKLFTAQPYDILDPHKKIDSIHLRYRISMSATKKIKTQIKTQKYLVRRYILLIKN